MTRIELKDNGQDFTTFLLDDSNTIVETLPFQGWVWNGLQVVNRQIKKGTRLKLYLNSGRTMTLRHTVETVSKDN